MMSLIWRKDKMKGKKIEAGKVFAKQNELMAKTFENLGAQILKCHEAIQAVAVALSEKGLLSFEDIKAARKKGDDYNATGMIIDWEKLKIS